MLPLTNLEKKLALKTAVEKAQLELALQALAKVGVIASAEEGISRASNDAIFEARVRSSSKGFCFALREDGGEDVYLRDHQLNHAWNGDRVLVKVTREGGRRRSPEGWFSASLSAPTPRFWPRWSARLNSWWLFPSTIGCMQLFSFRKRMLPMPKPVTPPWWRSASTASRSASSRPKAMSPAR